jgi:hypothetical protein
MVYRSILVFLIMFPDFIILQLAGVESTVRLRLVACGKDKCQALTGLWLQTWEFVRGGHRDE